MLEPISPSHIPEKPPKTQEESPLGKMQETADSEGYRFSFFRRSKKKKKNKGETEETNVYNENQEEQNPVNLTLSPEALQKLERQRKLKEKLNGKKE